MGVPEISVESSPGAIDFPSKRITLNDDNACITCPCIVVAKGVNATARPSPMDASLGAAWPGCGSATETSFGGPEIVSSGSFGSFPDGGGFPVGESLPAGGSFPASGSSSDGASLPAGGLLFASGLLIADGLLGVPLTEMGTIGGVVFDGVGSVA